MLTVNQQEKDLGQVIFGRPISFNYTLNNDGDKQIDLTRIVLGCGSCTKATSNTAILQPGSNAIIDAIFTPGSTGLAMKNIMVEYNYGGERQNPLILKFKATVVNG